MEHRKVTIYTVEGSYRGIHWVRNHSHVDAEVASIRRQVNRITGEFPIAVWDHHNSGAALLRQES